VLAGNFKVVELPYKRIYVFRANGFLFILAFNRDSNGITSDIALEEDIDFTSPSTAPMHRQPPVPRHLNIRPFM
jgi:hypothetical protein